MLETQNIPISHRGTELEGSEWKEIFFCQSMINAVYHLSID